ncbi:MAG: ABC transporter permease [Vicinamibacterales bacterium]
MAIREARASWRRLLFFFVCIAIGVAAIVALRSVIQGARAGIAARARSLAAADVLVQSNRPLTASEAEQLDALYRDARVATRTDAVEVSTMARPTDERLVATRLVEVLAVEAAWPLYGRVELADGLTYDHHLLRNRGALVKPELLTQLGVGVGDRVFLGRESFTIRGALLIEPGRQLGLSLGPRVLIDANDLPATGLLQAGSRARYVTLLALPENRMQPLAEAVERQMGARFISARSYRTRQERLGENFDRAENYLSLVGFVMVVLGGIGVWSVTRVFLRQKLRSIAVLKCVGATTGQIVAVYLTQTGLLGLAGSVAGLGFAALVVRWVPRAAIDALGGATPALTVSAAFQGLIVGVCIALLFAFVPLLDVRRVKPLWLLRDESHQAPPHRAHSRWRPRADDAVQWLATSGVVVVLALLAGWQAGSLRIGVLVCVGFIALAFVLHLAGRGLIRLVLPLAGVRWFPLRHAMLSIGRPGNQTQVVVLAVGLGTFLIAGIQAMQQHLAREFTLGAQSGGADMFAVDIQPDQVDALERLVRQATGTPPRLLPVLRARITGVHGRSVQLNSFDEVREVGTLAREYVITYRDFLERNERITDGTFWSGPSSTPEVSVEESVRDRYGVELGDVIRFDVFGRVVDARVTSVRHVDWGDTRAGGFVFVFRPGLLESGPRTYLGVLRAPSAADARARYQRDLSAAFPNISLIDVQEFSRTVEAVLTQVTLAISLVGGVALFSGLLILAGSVAMTKFQRLRDAAVFKTLGATSRALMVMHAVEYGTLGALAGGIGSLGAMALSWGICRYVLEITWWPLPLVSLAGTALATILVSAVGVLASLDVLRRRPLATLRTE